MFKKSLLGVVSISLLFGLVLILGPVLTGQAEAEYPAVLVNEQLLQPDVPPVLVADRVMVPLRAIFEALGAQVEWDEATKTVTGTKNNLTISLTIDSEKAMINNRQIKLDVPVTIIDGRTMVPTRFIAESLGAQVTWDAHINTVLITTGTAGAIPGGVSAVATANNQFALDFYAELGSETRNIFFSPHSISTALAMTGEGARGQTAREIWSVLHLPADDQQRRSAMQAMVQLLNQPDAQYQLHTANALWAQKDYRLLEQYVNTVAQYYGGKVTALDFVAATEASRQTINHWVAAQTNERIKDLIPPGVLCPLTRLVLTNAIYFKGDWLKPFEEDQTREEYFQISASEQVKVPLMSATGWGTKFNYTETETVQVLEMLYAGEDLSMLVLLPKQDLATWEQTLTLDKLNNLKSELRKQRVDVWLPKFTFDSQYTLNDHLKRLGMPTAFIAPDSNNPPGADFSGISGARDLYIHAVVHKAFVNVDEKGTEAAAATGVVVGVTAVELAVPVFRADRPFIFLIQERASGSILFMGRVANPDNI